MSTVSRNCWECVQRLRGGCENTTLPPGSRMTDPRTLRSGRGFPQFTPKLQRILIVQGFALAGMGCLGPDPVLVRPDREMWRARALRAKTAAFPEATARFGGRGDLALRRKSTLSKLLASWRDAGRETYPPHFTLLPMPP